MKLLKGASACTEILFVTWENEKKAWLFRNTCKSWTWSSSIVQTQMKQFGYANFHFLFHCIGECSWKTIENEFFSSGGQVCRGLRWVFLFTKWIFFILRGFFWSVLQMWSYFSAIGISKNESWVSSIQCSFTFYLFQYGIFFFGKQWWNGLLNTCENEFFPFPFFSNVNYLLTFYSVSPHYLCFEWDFWSPLLDVLNGGSVVTKILLPACENQNELDFFETQLNLGPGVRVLFKYKWSKLDTLISFSLHWEIWLENYLERVLFICGSGFASKFCRIALVLKPLQNWVPKLVRSRIHWFWGFFCWNMPRVVLVLTAGTKSCTEGSTLILFWRDAVFSIISL